MPGNRWRPQKPLPKPVWPTSGRKFRVRPEKHPEKRWTRFLFMAQTLFRACQKQVGSPEKPAQGVPPTRRPIPPLRSAQGKRTGRRMDAGREVRVTIAPETPAAPLRRAVRGRKGISGVDQPSEPSAPQGRAHGLCDARQLPGRGLRQIEAALDAIKTAFHAVQPKGMGGDSL